MELREINNMCQDIGQKIIKVKQYFDNNEIPSSGEPNLIDNGEVFFTVISLGTAQAKAPEAEKYIKRKMMWEKISPSLNRGDFKTPDGKYIELKNSFTNKARCLNLRQIRLWQNIDEYLCIYIDEENIANSIFLLLTHEQMQEEVQKYGCATHGTIEANTDNANIEYSITIKIDSDRMLQWIEKYNCQYIKDIILGG